MDDNSAPLAMVVIYECRSYEKDMWLSCTDSDRDLLIIVMLVQH